MAETNEARIDKWLWAARIFKTRSIAADAIKNGRVTIQGVNVKPSRMVKAGEVVSVRKPPVTYSFKIPCPRYGTSHEEGTPCAGRVRGTGHGG